MKQPLKEYVWVRFARKPMGMQDVMAAARDEDGEKFFVEIQETISLTEDAYALFISNFMEICPWLAGKGGYVNSTTRQAVRVTCEGQPTLYVDPSGAAYGRYVGMEV